MLSDNQSLNQNHFPNVFNLASLVEATFEPTNWVVENLVPEGCILFAGRPKLGKSWFVLQLALAVASGENAFGEFPAQRADVLYLALEDTRRRLQSRAKRVLGDRPIPSGFNIAIEWSRIDEGGGDQLEAWLEQYPATRMVIIDTFQKIKSRRNASADFETLSRLTQIAHKFNIALLVVHHTRKTDADDPFDTVSGATAATSLADAMLVMKRARCSQDADLHITGRDIEESRKALRFDAETMTWQVLGDADQVWQSQTRTDIYKLLQTCGTKMRPREIADELNKPGTAIRKALSRMVRDGQIRWLDGGYYDLKLNERRSFNDPEREERRKANAAGVMQAICDVYGREINDFTGQWEDLAEETFVGIERAYGQEAEAAETPESTEEAAATETPPEVPPPQPNYEERRSLAALVGAASYNTGFVSAFYRRT